MIKNWSPVSRRSILRTTTLFRNPSWVRVSDIQKKCHEGKWCFSKSLAVRQPGSWDSQVVSLHELLKSDKYSAVFEHFSRGIAWRETRLFERYTREICEKGCLGKHRSIESLVDFYQRTYDELYCQIAGQGFKAPSLRCPRIRPMFVHLDRFGDLLWTTEGNHRLAMAHCLEITEIPVYLFWRHVLSPNGMERWER